MVVPSCCSASMAYFLYHFVRHPTTSPSVSGYLDNTLNSLQFPMSSPPPTCSSSQAHMSMSVADAIRSIFSIGSANTRFTHSVPYHPQSLDTISRVVVCQPCSKRCKISSRANPPFIQSRSNNLSQLTLPTTATAMR